MQQRCAPSGLLVNDRQLMLTQLFDQPLHGQGSCGGFALRLLGDLLRAPVSSMLLLLELERVNPDAAISSRRRASRGPLLN
jgi:hypothetical protein